MSSNNHPDVKAFYSALASFRRAVDERYPRITPPAPRPMPPPDEEDIELSPAYVAGDLDEDLTATAAISSRRP